MERRLQQRFKKQLPVRVSGTDRGGQPFSQGARVMDVSEQGVRLEGVPRLGGPGTIVTLEHNGDKAQYRVVWVGDHILAGQAGLVSLEPHRPIFGMASARENDVTPAEPSSFNSGMRQLLEVRRAAEGQKQERRQYKRYNCRGDAKIYVAGAERPERGTFSDLSRGGCFMELLQPIALDTEVILNLSIARRNIRVQGLVRSALPKSGVGIQFLRFEPDDLLRLEEVLAELERSAKELPVSVAGSEAPPIVTSISDLRRSLDAVIGWFESNEVLTRQEFAQLLKGFGRSQSR